MGQLALENKVGEKGEPAFDKNVEMFSLAHTQKELWEHSEKQSTHPAYFSLFLNKYFKILINNSDCEQDSSARANGPEEVGQHRQGADAQPSERRRRGDVPRRQSRVRTHGTEAAGAQGNDLTAQERAGPSEGCPQRLHVDEK